MTVSHTRLIFASADPFALVFASWHHHLFQIALTRPQGCIAVWAMICRHAHGMGRNHSVGQQVGVNATATRSKSACPHWVWVHLAGQVTRSLAAPKRDLIQQLIIASGQAVHPYVLLHLVKQPVHAHSKPWPVVTMVLAENSLVDGDNK